jgi:nitrite reductase/ring-hydroxylating ferredoxin subunit
MVQVLDQELSQVKHAVESVCAEEGIISDGYIRLAVIVCQKRHSSRFFFNDGSSIINPCPGEIGVRCGIVLLALLLKLLID